VLDVKRAYRAHWTGTPDRISAVETCQFPSLPVSSIRVQTELSRKIPSGSKRLEGIKVLPVSQALALLPQLKKRKGNKLERKAEANQTLVSLIPKLI